MGELFELFALVDVDVELGKTVENELSLIDEDLWFLLEELFAIFFHVILHGGAEHHDLLGVGSFDEDVLDVSSHLGVS